LKKLLKLACYSLIFIPTLGFSKEQNIDLISAVILKSIQLTNDQKAFVFQNGLKFERYAKVISDSNREVDDGVYCSIVNVQMKKLNFPKGSRYKTVRIEHLRFPNPNIRRIEIVLSNQLKSKIEFYCSSDDGSKKSDLSIKDINQALKGWIRFTANPGRYQGVK
jgi:hypothetical protein